MSSAWKRPKYGKVRPVPKPKPKAPDKPKVQELRAIYQALARAPQYHRNDLLSQAILWWEKNWAWVLHKFNGKIPLSNARVFTLAVAYLQRARESKLNADKEKYLTDALKAYRATVAGILETPDITVYMKKSREVKKKLAVKDARLAGRYDKILTLLAQCFPSVSYKFIAVDKNHQDVAVRLDHTHSEMYFSRDECRRLTDILRKKGLLALIIDRAGIMASAQVSAGKSIDSYSAYYGLLVAFEEWARISKDAPPRLVRRSVVKKQKGAKPKQKGVVAQLLGPMSEEEQADVDAYMANAVDFKIKA